MALGHRLIKIKYTKIESNKNLYAAKTDPKSKDVIASISEKLHELYYDSKKLYAKKYGLA